MTYQIKLKTYTVREATSPAYPNVAITRAIQAAPYLAAVINEADAGREHFAVLFLNQKHRLLACKVLFSGGLSETPTFPNMIARDALLLGASAIVLGHNHPSGVLDPSPSDEAVTRRAKETLGLIEVRVLDHIIINGSHWAAMLSNEKSNPEELHETH